MNDNETTLIEKKVEGHVLGVRIDAITWPVAIRRILTWALVRESRYVAICNVHVTVTAAGNPEFHKVIEGADMVTPDGAPVAWMLRRLGFTDQSRISGPDLMWQLLERCAEERVPVYFYGSTDAVLERLRMKMLADFPGLLLGGTESPPFRPLTCKEDESAIERINNSGAGIVFVGLGCPKQEQWMGTHRGKVKAVMIGVGAAFDFHAGTAKRAPEWMQNNSLEWLHRLANEPRRLWKRYLVSNTIFIWNAFLQLTGLRWRNTR